jgi:hypothetical protein
MIRRLLPTITLMPKTTILCLTNTLTKPGVYKFDAKVITKAIEVKTAPKILFIILLDALNEVISSFSGIITPHNIHPNPMTRIKQNIVRGIKPGLVFLLL